MADNQSQSGTNTMSENNTQTYLSSIDNDEMKFKIDYKSH